MKALFSLLLACCFAAPAAGSISDAIDATCRLRVPAGHDSQGRPMYAVGTGCAFAIADDELHILTNYHVTEGSDAIEVEFWSRGHKSQKLKGRSVWYSYDPTPHRDLCVVAVPLADFAGHVPAVVPLAPRDAPAPATTCTIVSVGCEEGRWPSAWRGHVLDAQSYRDAFKFLPPSVPGRSGSAVFDADCQAIVGIVGWRGKPSKDAPDELAYGIAMTSQEIYAAFDGLPAANETRDLDAPSLLRTSGEAEEETPTIDVIEFGGPLVPIPQPSQCLPGPCPPSRSPFRPSPRPTPRQSPSPAPKSSGPYPTLPAQPPKQTPPAEPAPKAEPELKSDLRRELDGLKSELQNHLTNDMKRLADDLKAELQSRAKSDLQNLADRLKADLADSLKQGLPGLAKEAPEAAAAGKLSALLGLSGPAAIAVSLAALAVGFLARKASQKAGQGGAAPSTPFPVDASQPSAQSPGPHLAHVAGPAGGRVAVARGCAGGRCPRTRHAAHGDRQPPAAAADNH